MRRSPHASTARFDYATYPASDGDNSHHYRVRIAKCSKCAKVEEINEAGVKNMPPEVVANKFRQLGWSIGNRPTRDVCPSCVGIMRAAIAAPPGFAVEIENEQGDVATINRHIRRKVGVKSSPLVFAKQSPPPPPPRPPRHARDVKSPTTTETKIVVDQPPKEPMSQTYADPPRKPGIAENRKIMEWMDLAYDTGKLCYNGDYSDAKAAEYLKVPRAWVTAVREQFYGPEKNEAQAQRTADIASLATEGAALLGMVQDLMRKIEALK